MRYLILFVILPLNFNIFCQSYNIDHNPLGEEFIFGKIDSIEHYNCVYNDSALVNKQIFIYAEKDNRLISKKIYSGYNYPDESSTFDEEYIYDQHGNLIMLISKKSDERFLPDTTRFFYSGNQLIYKRESSFNKRYIDIEKNIFEIELSHIQIDSFFYQNEKLIRRLISKQFYYDGEISHENNTDFLYTYDADILSNITNRIQSGALMITVYRAHLKYDKDQNRTEWREYSLNGNDSSMIVRENRTFDKNLPVKGESWFYKGAGLNDTTAYFTRRYNFNEGMIRTENYYLPAETGPYIRNKLNIIYFTPNDKKKYLTAEKTDKYVIYPVPAHDVIYMSGSDNSHLKYSIINLNGQTTQQGYLEHSGTSSINVQNLTPGIYTIKINDGKSWTVNRFIKK